MKEIEGYEFETYLVGVSVPSGVEEREDEIRARHGLKYAESIRSELSREIGKAIQKRSRGKRFSLRPDLKIDFNPYTQVIDVSSRKLMMGGRISMTNPDRKVFARQCPSCRGRGCQDCEYTGRRGGDTVEYTLGKIVLGATGGRRWRFGMERIDEKEISFLMSIFKPRKRSIKPEEIVEGIRRRGCDYSVEEAWIKAGSKGGETLNWRLNDR
jgi:tRNA pseudouridine synthase 10